MESQKSLTILTQPLSQIHSIYEIPKQYIWPGNSHHYYQCSPTSPPQMEPLLDQSQKGPANSCIDKPLFHQTTQ